MSIKNKHIKHKTIVKPGNKHRYICIQCVEPTKEKVVYKWSQVTCKNCLRRKK